MIYQVIECIETTQMSNSSFSQLSDAEECFKNRILKEENGDIPDELLEDAIKNADYYNQHGYQITIQLKL